MSDHAIVMTDTEGRISYWSKGAEHLFGYSASEAQGNPVDLIVPEEYRERHWEGFHRSMGAGVSKIDGKAINIPVKCRKGIVHVFPGRFFLLKDARNMLVGTMAIYSAPEGTEKPFTPVQEP